MKANELRIGNYIEMYGIYEEITGIKIGYNYESVETISYRDNDIESIKPIPLTEEWLLKFGFKNSYVSIGDLTLSCMDDIYYLSDEYENGFNLPDIQYVHQLQNLYFALTQRELKINAVTT